MVSLFLLYLSWAKPCAVVRVLKVKPSFTNSVSFLICSNHIHCHSILHHHSFLCILRALYNYKLPVTIPKQKKNEKKWTEKSLCIALSELLVSTVHLGIIMIMLSSTMASLVVQQVLHLKRKNIHLGPWWYTYLTLVKTTHECKLLVWHSACWWCMIRVHHYWSTGIYKYCKSRL